MVISGLVRQRDITSDNEVNSSKIAQMRIDYYGKGTVGEAQYGGWMARFMRLAWPFNRSLGKWRIYASNLWITV